jgi:hypothetical protein
MMGTPTHLTFIIDEETKIASQVVHDTDPSWWLQPQLPPEKRIKVAEMRRHGTLARCYRAQKRE